MKTNHNRKKATQLNEKIGFGSVVRDNKQAMRHFVTVPLRKLEQNTINWHSANGKRHTSCATLFDISIYIINAYLCSIFNGKSEMCAERVYYIDGDIA